MLVGTNFIILLLLFYFILLRICFDTLVFLFLFLFLLLFKPICCTLVIYTKEHKITQTRFIVTGGYRLVIPFS